MQNLILPNYIVWKIRFKSLSLFNTAVKLKAL